MKYKTLVIERGVRGHRLKKALSLKVPERQSKAEKRLLNYILESLSRRSSLIPFALNNFSTMMVARHLLFNRTGSPLTFYRFIDDFSCFCKWVEAEPDQLVNRCRDPSGNVKPKGIAAMTRALDEYIDRLQAKNLSPATIRSHLKNIISIFRINGIGLKLPYGLSVWDSYYERAPTRAELIRILDLANLRERVMITMLAVSGLRIGTLLKLQYRHVKDDLERGIIPIHIHVEAQLTKGKRCSYDTFLNEEASECLTAYLNARKMGTEKIPSEQIRDESPLIRAYRCKKVKTVAVATVQQIIHYLYFRTGLLEKSSSARRYELRTHSFRRFFRTHMASLGVDPDCIDYMMGRTVKDRYHDVAMKGVEYLRGVYMTSGICIRPKMKINKIDALKEILQTWGLDPTKILTREALDQITPTTKQSEADDRDTLISSKASQNYQLTGSFSESTGEHK